MDFRQELLNINIDITDDMLEKFQIYYETLISVNEKMNLTAITEKDEVYIKHFYDSLLMAKCFDLNNDITLCDVGSGAGFPSIPLAIIYPNIKVTIIDALEKRINFLKSLVKKLGIDNVVAFHVRAEDFAKEKRGSFDIVTARAVARLNVLAELCVPLVKNGGSFIALKGIDEEEFVEGNKAAKILGADFSKRFSFNLPLEMGSRNIYLYNKVRETPKKYPRLFKQIKDNPLR